jgi:cytochrome P460
MKNLWPALAVLACGGLTMRIAGQQARPTEGPKFNPDGRLQRPTNYREWIWLSSGLGMSYGPAAQANANADPPFDNVFVTPAAYRTFLATGKWADGTMFVLEVRSSLSKGSINRGGHYQGERRGLEVEVKDERRFPGKWAFFDFHDSRESSEPFPQSAACYSCHSQNGAVDNTFVQFYPTLLEVARQKGTLKTTAEEK